MSKFFVTGGAGFIGSHIVRLLLGEGHSVVVFDDLSTGSPANIEGLDLDFVKGDIRDINALREAVNGCDYVIHHAAEISVEKSTNEPEIVNQVNVDGTLNVLIAAKDAGVKRMTMASSSAIYGDTGDGLQDEGMLPNPISPYGASKIADEYYMSCFYNLYGFETVRLRYFNVYGERQNPNSTYAAVIPKFISNIIRDIPLTVNGDGEQCRDFVYAGDVARANLLACLTPGIAGQVFNIASEHPVTINDLAETLIRVSGKTVPVVHGAPLKGDIKYSRADITRAKNILGFAPKMTFEEGLRRTFASLSERLK